MNANDLKRLLDYLTSREGNLICFSKEDVEYLTNETDIVVCTAETDDVSPDRMKIIKTKLNHQTEFIADNFSCSLLLIEMCPAHELQVRELKNYFSEEMDTKFGLRINPQIASVRVTMVFSRKSIGSFRDLANQYEFDAVSPYILQLFGDAPIDELKELYCKLKVCGTYATDKSIRIASRWEGCYPMIDMNACVLNEQRVIVSPVAHCDSSLQELVNMDIYVDEEVQISENEVLAGLLLDMLTHEGGNKVDIKY